MRALISVILAVFLSTPALAQDAVPDRHVAISRNTDFYGSDLSAIFDTTLDACQVACLTNAQCQAFTFNQRSNACFPKSAVSQVSPFEGAISARIIATDAGVLAAEAERVATLSFLSPGDLEQARLIAENIGRYHSSDEVPFADLLAQARSYRANSDDFTALLYYGAALAVNDQAQLWLDYSQLALVAESNGNPSTQALRDRAVPAAIAGYLRAQDPALQAAALADLARALEDRGRGALMIPALMLAQDISPRRDTQEQLDRAIGLYGFRVSETRVESDSAVPRICVAFTEALVPAGVDYTPFVKLDDQSMTVEVNGNELCVDGATHGERVRVVLRQGLPAANGETLGSPTELMLYVRDRSPAVRFASRAYVLPRIGDIAIPIETVNLPSVDLTLRRMTDRNILRSMQEDLFASPLYDWSLDWFDSSMAEVFWHGSVATEVDLNKDTVTRIPLAEALAGQPAGIYVLSAAVPGADPYDNPPSTQWFILSDLGIATWMGNDGLSVMVRGLGDAQARGGVAVTLLSESNAVLGTAQTSPEGVARFAPGLTRGTGSSAPALVMAESGDDMAFLSLRDAAFDLSDRGVEGRAAAGPIDVFLTPDRGAYRAGETIHLTALMRDGAALALPSIPLTAILRRPDGVEYSRITSTSDQAGGHVFALPIAGNAPRGAWRIEVRADLDAEPLAATRVLVEDFLPERIDFDLALPAQIRLGDRPDLAIDARYLFGAPGTDLKIEGEAYLRPTTTLEQFPKFSFGRYHEYPVTEFTYFGGDRTGPDGMASVPLDLAEVAAAGRPLELTVTARLSEGSGRPVERRMTAPVLPVTDMIGIRPAFDGALGEGETARFDLIGLNPDLEPAPMQVVWTLNRISTRYQWYQQYGNWNWEPITTRERIATGAATLGAEPVRVQAPVLWGEYELVVERADGAYIASSVAFDAGWYASAGATDTPDMLEAGLDAAAYRVGDTAQFRFVPRDAGQAVITVMSDHVIAMQTVTAVAGENTVALPVTDEWGAGVYVSASLIRPMDLTGGRNPARALGLAHAAVDPGDKALPVTLSWNADVAPRGRLEAEVSVGGVAEGDTAYVTLAAVDVGILNLTAFQSPDPADYYFGQRRLGVELRDIYGQLIDGLNGAMGTVRSGGDAMAQMAMQSPPPTEELLAYFSGPVAVDASGVAHIGFDLPAFNGTVRLMAVAWSSRGVGQAAQDVIVRDPVVVTASVPRFMAPGDRSRLLLELTHAEGPAGDMALSVVTEGLSLTTAPPELVTLTEGGKATLRLPFDAGDVGEGRIEIALTTPDGRVLTKTLVVPVMANDPEISQMSRFTLAAGKTFTFDDSVFDGMVPGSGTATLSVGPLARFDAPGLLRTLDRYPYGCTEQVTSRALPLIYFDAVAQAMDLTGGDRIGDRIAESITAVLANQAPNGSFGLWSPDSGDLWLDAYVTDFLSRARAAGHEVPALAFRTAMDNLRNRVNYYPDFESGGEDLAYALMVLAREGAAPVGDLRYFADERSGAFTTPLGAAQLGAALALTGDQVRADRLFGQAASMLISRPDDLLASVWRADYGTNRRDRAAVLALAVAAGSTAVDREALAAQVSAPTDRPSTQEAAWTLMAADALVRDFADAGVTVDGQVPAGPVVQLRQQGMGLAPVQIVNGGSAPTDVTVTTFGVPSTSEPAGGNGYAISRDYYTLDGDAVDPAATKVGDRMVVVITVQPFGRQEARLMVSDPLPAGFEIDNPNLLQGGEISALDWLETTYAANAEFRADRFLAAVDWQSDAQFRLAYIVRAVSPGSFHQPAASVEDMYRPQMRARTAPGKVVIAE